MTIDFPAGPLVHLRASLIPALFCAAALAWVLAQAHQALVPDQGLRQPLATVIAFTYLIASMMAHEVGHGLGLWLCSLGLDHIEIGFGASVGTNTPMTHSERLVVTVCGPGLQAVLAALFLGLAPMDHLLWVLALIGLVEALIQALVPLGPSSDAAKIYRGIARTMLGDGRAIETAR